MSPSALEMGVVDVDLPLGSCAAHTAEFCGSLVPGGPNRDERPAAAAAGTLSDAGEDLPGHLGRDSAMADHSLALSGIQRREHFVGGTVDPSVPALGVHVPDRYGAVSVVGGLPGHRTTTLNPSSVISARYALPERFLVAYPSRTRTASVRCQAEEALPAPWKPLGELSGPSASLCSILICAWDTRLFSYAVSPRRVVNGAAPVGVSALVSVPPALVARRLGGLTVTDSHLLVLVVFCGRHTKLGASRVVESAVASGGIVVAVELRDLFETCLGHLGLSSRPGLIPCRQKEYR